MKKIYLLTYIILILFLLFLIVSCEDDAILEPQVGDDCPAGDSYCSLSLPSTNDYAYNIKKNPSVY